MKNKIEEAFEQIAGRKMRPDLDADVSRDYYRAGYRLALSELVPRVERLVEAHRRISQLENMELPDKNTVLKKHNVMASFSNTALTEWREFYATLDGIEGEK